MSGEDNKSDERRVNSDANAYFEGKFGEKPVYIPPGRFECTGDPGVMLVGNVGSGVIICIHDPEASVGGLLHIMLPKTLLKKFPNFSPAEEKAMSFVDELVENFIGALKRLGAGKNRIRIRLYGGTAILEEFADSGLINYVLAKDHLKRRGLMVANVDIGGMACRRLHFHPTKGRVECIKLRRKADIDALRKVEQDYLETLKV